MKVLPIIVLLLLVVYSVIALPHPAVQSADENSYDEAEVALKLDEYNEMAAEKCNARSLASWEVETNVGVEELVADYQAAVADFAEFRKQQYNDYFKDAIIRMEADPYEDSKLNRQLKSLKNMGSSLLSELELNQLTLDRAEMTAIYNLAKICPPTDRDCDTPSWSLDDEIQTTMSKSRDYDELAYVFTEWHDQSGKKMISNYISYVELMNKAADANGYDNAGDMWISSYEDQDFKANIDKLWNEVKPLYDLLHTYVKYKLSDVYGDKIDMSGDTIPAHILGNMWAQTWEDLYEDLKPYPDADSIDVNAKMTELNYDVKKMFEMSDDFYQSMGLTSNEMSYGSLALIEKPVDRTVTCHASAWDFCDGQDFRIKMCTHVDMHDFLVVHHEMGHIQYFLQYKDQPLTLRGGANPGFHEAVGDTIALSVDTAKHLKKVGLLDDDYDDSEESQINALFAMALKRVAFLPFGLLIDKWRWEVFSGAVQPENWNKRWWELKREYQKVTPPTNRDSAEYFDPGAKFHIPNDSQYIAYFVAHILEFQMYRALCIEAKEFGPEAPDAPLHNCDFYDSKEAGAKLAAGLSLGTSKHWSEALEAITGKTEISSAAILEYFDPLIKYMEEFIASIVPPVSEEEEILEKLAEYNTEAAEKCNARSLASWDMETNVGVAEYVTKYQQAVADYAEFRKNQYDTYFYDKIAKIDEYSNEEMIRQLKSLNNMGTSLLDETQLTQLTSDRAEMSEIYNLAKICPSDDRECDTPSWSLDDEIQTTMSKSRDYDELAYVFTEWHDQSGKKMISNYKSYVDLMNEAAKKNGYDDAGDMWISSYEDTNFKANIDELWNEVKPLYDLLHTYVKYKLSDVYGDKIDVSGDTIPAHILGNMWAQTWEDLYEDLKPYPDADSIDVNAKMTELNYDVKKMFEMSDDFYQSMGLTSNEMSYGSLALIEKPVDRTVTCHASAWDFCDGQDFRIKMCTHVDMHDFLVVHHEMGHIQYFLQYKDQPLTLRGGANPGFHEAVGDTIALSVDTAKHLKKVGLLDDDYDDSEESQINALFAMALKRVAFLPFGLLIDKWRWEVFSGAVQPENWNKRWWELKREYQKVTPPTNRDSAEYFDPGAKFHIPNDSQYIAYFVAHILEFQMYRALCIEAKEFGPEAPDAPLHNCDFYDSKEAGAKLAAGLSLGTSKHWSEALEAITGKTEISSAAILEYFDPLIKYMEEFIASIVPPVSEEEEILNKLAEYNTEAAEKCNARSLASWDMETNVGVAEYVTKYQQAVADYAEFRKNQYDTYFYDKIAKIDEYSNEEMIRQLKSLNNMGTSLLDETQLTQLTSDRAEMSEIYNLAKICPSDERECDTPSWSLDDEIQTTMSKSRDYDELAYVFTEWHDQSGKKMISNYKSYVDLMNEAAKKNGYDDAGDMWISSYEDTNFKANIDELWNEVKPLYDLLHTYVKYKLSDVYGDKIDVSGDTIPAHILGNMWAQTWEDLYEDLKPYPDADSIDVNAKMTELNYDVKKMFEMSDDFYQSMGLTSNEMSYGSLALIEKPVDRTVTCHASAWDFCDGQDFRIKMCTHVDMHDFLVVHHEMGHIQYFLQYKDQPLTLRGGANPGFHEAVGDTIALSVDTAKHLKKVGLLDDDYDDSEESQINALFAMALKRVAFLPFGLLIDKWRWEVFSGAVQPENWNKRWWELKREYQKVTPPTNRDSAEYFDPGAKFHIPNDSQYIAYFVAHILEFQMYRALCIEAKEFGPEAPDAPLHNCDFYDSKEAGAKLAAGLSLGTSKHWSEALEAITGKTEISSAAILEYFDPLIKYMEEFIASIVPPVSEEEEILEKLAEYNTEAAEKCNARSLASWDMETNVGVAEYVTKYQQAVADYAEFRKNQYDTYFYDKIAKIDEYSNEEMIRQLKSLNNMGTSLLDETQLTQLTSDRAKMSEIYNLAKICPSDDRGCDTPSWSLDDEIQTTMSKSRDYDELAYVFTEWHDQSGKEMISYYKSYVVLMNEAAKKNGYDDAGDMWISSYENSTFKANIDELWNEVKPLYDELHKYVRHKLSKKYGDKFDAPDDTIPAHILGNMWAQTWEDLYEDLKPYPDAASIDVNAKMAEQNYDVKKMFEMSDDFYQSMGLASNEMSYQVPPAMIEKPDDRDVTCHASAWDFCDGQDFRIKMCTHVDMHDFLVVHHEMGHIQYYLQYKDKPLTLRGGANPGFHEAVGDTIALSVDTAKHLKIIGLLDDDFKDSEESQINALFSTALKRVAFLPFGLLIDKWRWEVFSGEVQSENWNKRWWALRKEYQKVVPPTNRDSDEFFDPGAKFHIPNDSQYIAYFVARILQFQMYRALCIEAKEYGPEAPDAPLHNCDFYDSAEAGAKLAAGLSLGTSKHWSEALQAITGEAEISSAALMEYFAPLKSYLEKYNEAIENLEKYNEVAPQECNTFVKAEWDANIDVENKDKQEKKTAAALAYSKFLQNQARVFENVEPGHFDDELEQRQIREIKQLGTSILGDADFEILQKTISDMEVIYNTATICAYNDTEDCNTEWSLDPEIEARLAESTDYDELLYVWKAWRDSSGKLMRDDYKTYVELSNKAAKANGYKDYGEMWVSSYEDDDFKNNIDSMWDEVKDLYNELHKYVLKKLKKLYGTQLDAFEDNIPAHILGNMWAQSWVHLYDRIVPYKNGTLIDVTDAIKEKYTTVKEMFEAADQFYIDLGLEPMPMSYGEKALITKPVNTIAACHASAWDFCDGNDFRIKMCTNQNMEDFVTIHHEMGHIQYYLLYKDLPIALRAGANPGFHEAVGDLIALSVSTPNHLQKIGLLEEYEDSRENDINSLFKMALERVAFLPFGLLIDKWRWDVFSGTVPENKWNEHWWDLRKQYQKVVAPVERTEEDFDPGAKYHIPADSKYISYFIAHILEFQLHRAMCIEAGQYDPEDETSKPLYQCDIDKSTAAGKKLRDGLSLGFSKHWSESLKAMTGQTEISGKALMEYFEPLYTFLKVQNARTDEDGDDKNDDDAGCIIGGDKGVVVSIALLAYGIFSWVRS